MAAMESRISCCVTLAFLAVMVPWLTAHSPSTGRSNTLIGVGAAFLRPSVRTMPCAARWHRGMSQPPDMLRSIQRAASTRSGGAQGQLTKWVTLEEVDNSTIIYTPVTVPADAKVGALCREVKASRHYPAGYINPGNVLLQNRSISVADTVAEAFKDVGDNGRNPIRFYIKRAPRPVRWALLFPIGLPVPIYD